MVKKIKTTITPQKPDRGVPLTEKGLPPVDQTPPPPPVKPPKRSPDKPVKGGE